MSDPQKGDNPPQQQTTGGGTQAARPGQQSPRPGAPAAQPARQEATPDQTPQERQAARQVQERNEAIQEARAAARRQTDEAERGPAMVGGGRRQQATAEAEPPQIDQAAVGNIIAVAMKQMQVQRAATAPTPDMDETIPGGLYVVEGKVVDAWNNELKTDEEKAAEPTAPTPRREP
jgi:hypothetical protein